MGLEHEELSGSVIGAAIEVHKALGPGSKSGASLPPNGHTMASWLPGFLGGHLSAPSLEDHSCSLDVQSTSRRSSRAAITMGLTASCKGWTW